jgi:hypothetical protein
MRVKIKNILLNFIKLMLVFMFAISCKEYTKTSYQNLGTLLTDCKGYGVVVATGYNEGNFDAYKYQLIIKDSTGVCRQYFGAKTDAIKGDTLIIKN